MEKPKSKRESFYVSFVATSLMVIIGGLVLAGVVATAKLLIAVIVK